MATISPVLDHREHDHRRCAADALRHAEAISRREGLRFTPQRRQVLEALLESHVPASAYDVIDRLAEHGRRAGAGLGLSRARLPGRAQLRPPHRIEERLRRLRPRRRLRPGATLFLICDNCGAAGEASSAALHRLIAEVTAQVGFRRGAGARDPRPLRQLPVRREDVAFRAQRGANAALQTRDRHRSVASVAADVDLRHPLVAAASGHPASSSGAAAWAPASRLRRG